MNAEQSTIQLVSFRVGEELFGAPIDKVHEIIRSSSIVKVPQAPDFIEGIINLRGKIITVIDLRKKFQMATAATQAASRIIVADIAGTKVGIMVDAVSIVLRVSREHFEKTPAIISGIDRKFISGVVKENNMMLLALDLDKLLTQQELELLQKVE
ncbi:MAG TPA: chemotaxis protein CheW [Elusimicrobiales bacterium]|nr:chemotaxis protein CheW [Elusimicrobiales bacterium]